MSHDHVHMPCHMTSHISHDLHMTSHYDIILTLHSDHITFHMTSHDLHMTGFAGNVTSVGFMDVRLEEDPAVNEEDENELNSLSSLYDNIPYLSTYMTGQSDSRKDLGKKKSNGRKKESKV